MDILGFRQRGYRAIFVALFVAILLVTSTAAELGAADAQLMPPSISMPRPSSKFGFADLVAAVRPAVVNISTTQNPRRQMFSQTDSNNTFGDVVDPSLGPDAEQALREHSWSEQTFGSGFLIDPSGYIVTNDHVIGDANKIQVALTDGTIYPARIVGRDAKTDLALLKVGVAKSLPYIAFGNSGEERVGDWVMVVGNAYGLGASVSAGIVSGSNRDIDEGPYDDFLQIDAPVNPGDSGGPLFNRSGQVIGVDTAIYSSSGGSVGIGFAIPSNIARKVIAELRKHGHVTRGWLGVQYQTLTPALANAIGLHKAEGVLVDLAKSDSPAARGGIQQGDVIETFDGRPILTSLDLALAVADTRAGQTVPLTVWRDGEERNHWVTIGTEETHKFAAANTATRLDALGRIGTAGRKSGP